MKKVTLRDFIVASVAIFLILVLIIDFLLDISFFSVNILSWLSLILFLLALLDIFRRRPSRFGFRLAILTYYSLTQFSLYWVCISIPIANAIMSTQRYIDGGWLRSSNMVAPSIELGIIGFLTMYLGFVSWPTIRKNRKREKAFQNDIIESRYFFWGGIIFCAAALILLIISIMSGRFSLSGNYVTFRNAYSDVFASTWAQCIMFSTLAISFCVPFYNTQQFKLFVLLFSMIAIIVLGTGNKGEILFPLAAAMGCIYNVREGRIPKRIVVLAVLILIVLIPTITTFRYSGFALNQGLTFNIASAFLEIGSQARCTVFILEEFSSGIRQNYLNGYSYYSPIINIINRVFPFISRLPIPSDYYGYTFGTNIGYSQVAESYQNFGLFGVIIFHLCFGLFLSHLDYSSDNIQRMTLHTSWTAIFVMMCRNHFSSVLPTMLYYFIYWIIVRVVNNALIGKKRSDK